MSTIKKIITTGMGAALMTEEGLRGLFENLPQQAAEYLSRQLLKGKEEIGRLLIGEFKKFLSHINIQKEIRSALEDLDIEVTSVIRVRSSRLGNEEARVSFRKPASRRLKK